MEENKQKNSRRRLNSLILLVAFTAIMLIVSTYAWFSTQKTVTLSNLTGIVKVAEGLEISLDALNWSQEIDFAEYTPDQLKNVCNLASDHNIVPTEMLPVSSNGAEGINALEIPFYRGTNTNTKELSSITETSLTKTDGEGGTVPTTAADNEYPGYYAIDLFLRNSGLNGPVYDTDGITIIKPADVQGTTKETLQLTSGSKVTVISGGNDQTGLQNTPRVAFALYSGTADVSEGEQSIILGDTMDPSSKITDVAIWEPNSNAHVSNTLTNFNDITWRSEDVSGYLAVTGATPNVNNLISVNSDEASIYTKNPTEEVTEFQILKNTTIRVRMYVWLEGQDPDCVNFASHGGGIEVDLGLCKGEDTSISGS